MSLFLRRRWGLELGLGAAAGALVIGLAILLLTPKIPARAAEVMAKGAQALAKLTSIHLRGQLRTLPADNFSYIDAEQDFCPIELWKQLEPKIKWRVEKPGRVAAMDGRSVLLYIRPAKEAVKADFPSEGAFDTDWLHRIANLSHTISNELKQAQAKGWKLELTEQTGTDGNPKAVVTVHARSDLADDDYIKNSFLDSADTRRVYRFDAKSGLLEAVQIYLVKSGAEKLIFELSHIDYNPSLEPGLWEVVLPADVGWHQEPQKLPDNDRYASMTAQEAARAFFEACGREDWDEAGKFVSPVDQVIKNTFGGAQIISLGKPFTSKAYAGCFVPYEIRLRGSELLFFQLANTNAAKRYVITGIFDSNFKPDSLPLAWSNEPAVLENNAAYARMTPQEVVQAAFNAITNQNWSEAGKFVSDSYVQHIQAHFAEGEKKGLSLGHMLDLFPKLELGEATWSDDRTVCFVKCRLTNRIRTHNLALRNDNAVGRWQVDGGY